MYPSTFCLDPFHTRVSSECKKFVRLPIKGDGSALVKGIIFFRILLGRKEPFGCPLSCVLVLVLELLFPFIVCAR
jgi:hypothetical protein